MAQHRVRMAGIASTGSNRHRACGPVLLTLPPVIGILSRGCCWGEAPCFCICCSFLFVGSCMQHTRCAKRLVFDRVCCGPWAGGILGSHQHVPTRSTRASVLVTDAGCACTLNAPRHQSSANKTRALAMTAVEPNPKI